jgi:phage tail sheath protein FI
MWGQKTAQKKASALDRINVRRLLLYIENTVEPSLLPFLFENNNDRTRSRVFAIVDQFLATVQAGGGLTAYRVVCDSTNNTSQVVDNNQLNVDIYVQPSKAIEFIQLQTVITRSGVNFNEVV